MPKFVNFIDLTEDEIDENTVVYLVKYTSKSATDNNKVPPKLLYNIRALPRKYFTFNSDPETRSTEIFEVLPKDLPTDENADGYAFVFPDGYLRKSPIKSEDLNKYIKKYTPITSQPTEPQMTSVNRNRLFANVHAAPTPAHILAEFQEQMRRINRENLNYFTNNQNQQIPELENYQNGDSLGCWYMMFYCCSRLTLSVRGCCMITSLLLFRYATPQADTNFSVPALSQLNPIHQRGINPDDFAQADDFAEADVFAGADGSAGADDFAEENAEENYSSGRLHI